MDADPAAEAEADLEADADVGDPEAVEAEEAEAPEAPGWSWDAVGCLGMVPLEPLKKRAPF